MLVETFEDVQKEYNAGDESCRVSLEGRLRQDTFEALQVLNAESWRGEDVPEIVQGNAEGKCAKENPRVEGYSGESYRISQKRISPAAQETSQTVRQRGLRASQPTDVPRSWNYQQRTRITGEDPLKVSLGTAYVARKDGGKNRTGRGHIIGPRSIDVYRSGKYWQKTRITGKDPLDVSGGTTRMAQEDELIEASVSVSQRSSVSVQVNDSGNETRKVQEKGDVMSYKDLSGTERTALFGSSNMGDRVNEIRAGLEIRTFTDIFQASQRDYEEKRVRDGSARKRARRSTDGQLGESGAEEQSPKRARTVIREGRDENRERNGAEEEEVAALMLSLEEEFEEKERLSHGGMWCEPILHERKVSTVCEFYNAFHDLGTMAIRTCIVCYRKFAIAELVEFDCSQWTSTRFETRHGSQFNCRSCFPNGKKVLACAECIRELKKGVLSPAAGVHNWLRCEHTFPDELKDLTPVEEKLIALNSCYGFITKFSVVKGHRESATYPKHIKGHITVFPNNVQELVTQVLPHPLLKVMDEIHVSWQGAQKPAPKDLSILLSVRRRVVERALVWLRRNNPLYANIEINTAEMESWGSLSHGVPFQVYERLEHDEPTVWEKVRTAQLVPPTERDLEGGDPVDVREILTTLNQVQAVGCDEMEEEYFVLGSGDVEGEGDIDGSRETIQEISASGMFALDAHPDVEDTEKLRYIYDALGRNSILPGRGQERWSGSAEVRSGNMSEPYILVSRGEDFANSNDVWFFAKAFPTLFPFGGGGPRQAEENMSEMAESLAGEVSRVGEATAENVASSRNLSLETWVRIVLQRHGGRFATHRVFTFLVFNMLVRFRNHQVSMMSVTRKEFPKVERIVQSLSAQRLERAREELKASGKTTDGDVNQVLRSLSLYGFRQPMSRELRLSMRRKIKSLIIREGIPAIWFTLNPNDITNPVKLRLAAYRLREPEEAEAFLTSLDASYKRVRLAISDPLSSALFFHREISMFFKYYVKVGDSSVFGRISQYFGAVETNERGALHLHGLLWLHGNMCLNPLLKDVEDEGGRSYRDRVIQYVDSVFTEDLDQEAFYAIQAERTVTSDISSMLRNREQFSTAFEEEANFCAGATQIHTHSPTCVKYSIGRPERTRNLCRFKAPWRLVEKTAFKEGGVLEIRRNHNMVNRWNKAIAVGLRHNHDICFIGTQSRTMAIVFYVTNYATKVEDPIWKRAAAAAELLDVSRDSGTVTRPENRARQFLVRVANRVFTERALSQVEVAAHLLGFRTEFTHNEVWTYLNVSSLYWEIFRRWDYLRYRACENNEESVDETVMLERSGQKTTFVQAYPHRGQVLAALSLYDYMSVVKLKRKRGRSATRGELEFEGTWPLSKTWVQALRKPGEHAVVSLDGYLSMDFSERDERYHRRAAVQHLAMFVPWEHFLSDASTDINSIWERQKQLLPRRLASIAENIQLLRRSAEDAKRDARQWADLSEDADSTAYAMDPMTGEGDEGSGTMYRADDIGNATRLIDVLISTMGTNRITAGSKDMALMVQQLYHFQEVALYSSEDLLATVVCERGIRTMNSPEGTYAGADIPDQTKVKSIKSQQVSASREREKMIQGIQEHADGHSAAAYRVLNGFGEDDISIMPEDSETVMRNSGPSTCVQFGPSTSFSNAGKQVAESFTLNRRQSIALRLLCRHLDRVQRSEKVIPQLCQFVGGEGGTGKSRVIEALVTLFARKGMPHRLVVTATSGTAAASINGMTIHSACNFSVDISRRTSDIESAGFAAPASTSLRVDGQSRMDWQEKYMLIIDEISMLGARTLHAVNEQLCILRGCTKDFGGIPIVLFCGDFHQFRPVQERSILVPSSDFRWDEGKTIKMEQRHQHDKAHSLWRRFTTVVMLNEQVRAAGDVQLQRLLTRIRNGVADQNDVDLLNRTCYREGRRIPWESGITVITALNRNRWNLNIEAILSYQKQHQAQLRIFVSEHKWKDGQPTEEEALMILSYGDDSSVPVPAIFMFVSGMPVVVNRNTHQGLKLVNGAYYKALDVVLDQAYPGHRISADTVLHFGPPAGIILTAESTKDFNFVGMPPGTILLTPLSSKIECVRRRPWQKHDVTRRGLPCTAAFACTDYKVQGRTLEKVAVELRGTRITNVDGQAVPSQCDPYSLYVQLSRCRSLDGIMLLSKVRERDVVGNTVPENMIAAEKRLEELSEATIREAESWDWSSPK